MSRPVVLCCLLSLFGCIDGALYPQESETREVKTLDGLWWFVQEPKNSLGFGLKNKWWKLDFADMANSTKMPVPSSYNDADQSVDLRDHVGWVWYQRDFFIPTSWKASRTVLRFGSVNYYAMVWLNGKLCSTHVGGHLPFEAQINSYANFNGVNRVTVAVNNTLSPATIPPGEFQYKTSGMYYPKGFFVQTPDFDFFNYAGIQRSVTLYRTPKIFVNDITVQTSVAGHTDGVVDYMLNIEGIERLTEVNVSVKLVDRTGHVLQSNSSTNGTITIENANLWWPRGTNKTVGYLYDLVVDLIMNDRLLDRYTLPIGIRSVAVSKENAFLINGVPFYFKGCGMHEDSDIRGRGFDYVVMNKDLNLLQWLNANSFRTSHYPYSEERLIECDRRGIVVISETPAVGLKYFNRDNLDLHKEMLTELIQRDKNHPSVVMWSLSNEPLTDNNNSRSYFQELVKLAKNQDHTRPLTIVYGHSDYNNDKTADFIDVMSVNRYYGWYSNTGHLEVIKAQMLDNISQWYKKFNKPILVTEYGADSMVGLYTDPPMDFSESYQVALMKENHLAFDKLRTQSFFIGEMFWNFADFMTAQETTRAVGNRKGVFTRNRQPKMAAYLMRKRYGNLGSQRSQDKEEVCSDWL